MKSFVVVGLLTVLAALSGMADGESASITVTWSPNNEPDLAGYVFYERIGHEHIQLAVIPKSREPSYRVKRISVGRHFYSVTAFDLSGLESDYSEEVVYTR